MLVAISYQSFGPDGPGVLPPVWSWGAGWLHWRTLPSVPKAPARNFSYSPSEVPAATSAAVHVSLAENPQSVAAERYRRDQKKKQRVGAEAKPERKRNGGEAVGGWVGAPQATLGVGGTQAKTTYP